MTRIDLSPIEAFKLDRTVKGMPGDLAPTALEHIGGKGWNVLSEDLPLPLAVMRESAIRHNSSWMSTNSSVTASSISTASSIRQPLSGNWRLSCAKASSIGLYR